MSNLSLSNLNFARFIERAKVGQIFVIHYSGDDCVESDYNNQYVLLAINDDEELYITDMDIKFVKRCVLDTIFANDDNTYFDRFDIPEILIETYCPGTEEGIYKNTFFILDSDITYDIETEVVQSFKLVRDVTEDDEYIEEDESLEDDEPS